jgi:hypothetical protein
MTLFICAMLVAFLIVTIAALYIEHRQHRELLAMKRAPSPAMLHLARQVEALQADVDALKGGQS